MIVDAHAHLVTPRVPLCNRKLLLVSEEATGEKCADGPHRVMVWDIADETKPRMLSVAPFAADSLALCAGAPG